MGCVNHHSYVSLLKSFSEWTHTVQANTDGPRIQDSCHTMEVNGVCVGNTFDPVANTTTCLFSDVSKLEGLATFKMVSIHFSLPSYLPQVCVHLLKMVTANM